MASTDNMQTVENDTPIAQVEHLLGIILGHVHGAQVVAEVTATTDGVPQRYEVVAARFEGVLDDPQRRLVLTLSDCVHYSDPVNGCGALRLVP